LNRREVLKGGLATLGFMALPGGLPVFAAPAGWKPKKKPNLVFGVVSDTHMRCHYDGKSFYSRYDVFYDDQALVEVMKVFKKAGVDAILHCGDVTDNGMVREMEFYKEAWDKVYGSDPRPVNMICTGNHDVAESYYWAQAISHSKDPAVYKKIRLGPHNIKKEMERIWGEPYDDVWHKTVKGYHFFGFGCPMWPEEGWDPALPYKGWLYNDTKDEGKGRDAYIHAGLHLVELVRREREARRLDPQKPFFFATHAFYARQLWFAHRALRQALGVGEKQFCNGLGFHGHGHGSDAHWRFNWGGDAPFPHVMCSTLAYWKSHGGEGEKPRFAKDFGDGTATGNMDLPKADHALLVRVYDDMVRISRIWVNVKPKHVVGSLGPDWVMPLSWGTGNGERGIRLRQGYGGQAGNGESAFAKASVDAKATADKSADKRGTEGWGMNDHPLREENYVKVIGSPEFPKGAKLDVKLEKIVGVGERNDSALELQLETPTVLRIRIPKADGNPDSRVYGYNVVVAGEDGTKLKKSVYARGYCMGIGYEPEGGVTTLDIPQSELPAGKLLSIAVRPCSSLATRGKPIATTWRA